jgi:hypothetical protein
MLLTLGLLFCFMLFGGHKAAALGDNFPPGNSVDNDWLLLSRYKCPGHCLNTPNADIRVFYSINALNNDGVTPGQNLEVDVQIDCRYIGTPNGNAVLDGGTSRPNWPNATCTGLNTNSGNSVNTFFVQRQNLDCSQSGPTNKYTGWCFTTLHLSLAATPGNEPILGAWVFSADDLGNVKITPAEELNPTANYTNTDCYQGYEFSFNGDNQTCTPPGGLAPDNHLFTLWNNFNSNGPGTHHNWQVRFGPDCTVTKAETVYLRWYDADDPGIGNDNGTQSNGGTADTSLNIDLFDNTTGQYIFKNVTNLGGNDSYRDRGFTVKPGHDYTWTWNNVSATNGIQLWNPFSEIGTIINCPGPTDWRLDATSSVTDAATGAPIRVVSTRINDPNAQKVKFNHIIHNFGPDPATYNGQVMGTYNNNGYDATRCGNNGTADNTIQNTTGVNAGFCPGDTRQLTYFTATNRPVGDSPNHPEEFQFPSNAAPGDTYCEYIAFSDPTGPGTSTGGGGGPYTPNSTWGDSSDDPACVTYNPFATTLNSVGCQNIKISSNTSYYIKVDNLTTGASNQEGPYAGNQNIDPFQAWQDIMYPHFQYNFSLIDNSGGGATITGSPQFLDKCMGAACLPSLQVSGDPVEPGQTTNIGYGIIIANATSRNFGNYGAIIWANPGLNMNPNPNYVGNAFPPASFIFEGTTWPVTANYQGNMHAVLTFNLGDISAYFSGLPCDSNPYTPSTRATMRVTSGDIATGGGFGNSSGDCSATALFSNGKNRYTSPSTTTDKNAGGLRTFAVPNAGKGSGGDFAAYALGYIDGSPSGPNGFYTAAAATSNNTYNALMFANTEPGNLGGLLGGDFTDAHCAPDYFDSTITTPHSSMPDPPGGAKTNVTSLNTKQYYHNGDLELKGGNINAGVRPTLYVDGNVTITGDITYSPWQFDTTNYNNNAPYFTLIVRGNIYVDSSVGEINGLYIAQPNAPDGTDGSFVSCSNGSAFPNSGFIGSSCQSQLNVKGSVIAQHVYALRAKDTLSQYANTSSASEIFDYLPSIVVGQPNFSPSTGGAGVPSSLENLTNLPPVF